MLRYGIPAYRFPRERLDEDIRGILVCRIHHRRCCDTRPYGAREMARDRRELRRGVRGRGRADGQDAARCRMRMRPGVMSAVDLLGGHRATATTPTSPARTRGRGGRRQRGHGLRAHGGARGAAEVTVVYRRRKEDMTALSAEIESAIAEGVEMIVLQAPVGIETDEAGRCAALITQPQMIGAGARRPTCAD